MDSARPRKRKENHEALYSTKEFRLWNVPRGEVLMPYIKLPFNPYHIPSSVPVLCNKCGRPIERGSYNWTVSTSKAIAKGDYLARVQHKDCAEAPSQPVLNENKQKKDEKNEENGLQNSPTPKIPTPESPALEDLIDRGNKIREVRDHTQAPIENCRKALESYAWDVNLAIAFLTLAKIKPPQNTAPTPPTSPQIKITPKTDHYLYNDLLKLIGGRMDSYLGGSPGAGKSYAIRKGAESLGLRYAYIALSDATMPSALFGYQNASGDYVQTVLYDYYLNGGVLDIAELDNTNANVFTLLNNMLDNGRSYFPGICKEQAFQEIHRHKDFVVIGNGNTFLRGPDAMFPARQRQDAAAIERFVVLNWGYDSELEYSLCGELNRPVVEWAHKLRKICSPGANKAQGHELVVSMRGILKLARLVSLGFDKKQAALMAIFKEYDQTETLLNLCPLTF